jgi:hypothetical protein
MTSGIKRSPSRPADAKVANWVLRTEADAGHVDAAVVPVGTFAAGQSADGRHVAATTAPQGTFAEGQADELALDR